MDRRLKLTELLDQSLADPRNPSLIVHSQLSLLRQRIYAIALGYEDLNDHGALRLDPAIQTAVNCDEELGSASTLCRLENRTDRQAAVRFHEALVDQFIASFQQAPKELILDFDATDDAVHGTQEGRAFNGYYDHYCFLPLYVFCDKHLLVSYLRPSNIDGAQHSWAILSLLVKRLRREWPQVKITFRADSGFCRWRMLRWCDRHNVNYIVGLARNPRLEKQVDWHVDLVEKAFRLYQKPHRYLGEIRYAAKTWDRERRVIFKVEHNERGPNKRFVVTNLRAPPATVYDEVYCARGEMENRIKEQQLGLFADRTSCHYWWANQFRLLLASCAYTLINALRLEVLHDTELSTARVDTIRLKLFKIGTVIIRNTRRVRFLYSSRFAYQELFAHVVERLVPT